MNRHTHDIHDELEQVDHAAPKVSKIQSNKQRRMNYGRRGAPTVFNGIHRRRRKRIKW